MSQVLFWSLYMQLEIYADIHSLFYLFKLILQLKLNHTLIFYFVDRLKCHSASGIWYAVGTFYIAPKYFYQLYVIQLVKTKEDVIVLILIVI